MADEQRTTTLPPRDASRVRLGYKLTSAASYPPGSSLTPHTVPTKEPPSNLAFSLGMAVVCVGLILYLCACNAEKRRKVSKSPTNG